MALLIPFAAPLSEDGRQALRALPLPRLQAWLAAGTAERWRDDGPETSLTPPHERALARAWGLAGPDGGLPWAATRMPADGREPGELAWGLVTPVHWQVGSEQVVLGDPEDLRLAEADSRALFDAAQPLFADDGWVLLWGAPLRWYLAHGSLAELATASLDRAIGRSVDAWLPARDAGPTARVLRRLQNELQMLWHTHPVNAAREAQGLPPVNSFWLSGCGVRQPVQALPAGWTVDDRLRRPALAEDWGAWCEAWRALDAGPVAALSGHPDAELTLCGERGAVTLAAAPRPWWRRWAGAAAASPAALLETL